jgi:hypothetical protein
MNMNARVGKVETVVLTARAQDVPCTWHALCELDPSRPASPADIVSGACHECGGELALNVEGATMRERELSAELFAVGTSLATLTASRRVWAAILWLSRRGKKITARADETYKQALIDEGDRRRAEQWRVHLTTVSDEMLTVLLDLGELTTAELEAIIWPGSDDEN